MTEYSLIGRRLPGIHDQAKAMGEAKYVDDIVLPRMLYGAILRSPYPHAKILNIDITKAQRIPGVKVVITGKDIPKVKYGIVPKAADEYALAITKIRYIGDEVAAVAATDPDTAEEALSLIRVNYEVLPPVFDPEEAMKPEAPRIHEEIESNISARIRRQFGDIEKGFAQSYHFREDKFYSQAICHTPLEPHGSIGFAEPSGKITLWASTQIPFFLRRNLAKTLNIQESMVRIIKPFVGGGFGGKVDMFSKDFCSAFLSMKTGRPVKMIYTREESLTTTRQRHPMIILVKTGVKGDGTLNSQKFLVIADGGAYNSTAPLIITISYYFAMIPYKVPNLSFEGCHVYTNKPVGGAMRGHGTPQIRFAAELQLDMIAEDMKIDPMELRMRNALYAHVEHPIGIMLNSCGFKDTLNEAAREISWGEKRGKRMSRGVGMGCSAFPSGVNNMRHIGSGAIIKVHVDGAVTLLTGASDIGQGSDSVLAQIAAEELGIGREDIRITSGDTELTPLDSGTFGSGVTFRAGNAVKRAAAIVRKKLFEAVAESLEANAQDLEAKNGKIYVKGSPQKGISFKEALKTYQYSGKPTPIIGRGFYIAPVKEASLLRDEEGNFSPAYSFSTQAAEVEVCAETGKIKVLKFVSAHDCGKALNPMAVEGQLEGSLAGGLGHALMEELKMDKGSALNPGLLTYAIPTALEIPPITSIHVEPLDPEGPFGAKEAGEGTQVATAPAIINAIHDATGVWIKELPATPEKILGTLEREKSQ